MIVDKLRGHQSKVVEEWLSGHQAQIEVYYLPSYELEKNPDEYLNKIYRNRTNLSFCKEHGIAMNGPKLGRPPKDKTLYDQQKLLERSEAGERNQAWSCPCGSMLIRGRWRQFR